MSKNLLKLLEVTVSLGFDGELGFFQRHHGIEWPSLLAFSEASAENVIRFINAGPQQDGFQFHNLQPAGGGLVRDTLTGFLFHSGMRSSVVEHGYRFDDNDATRKIHYRADKKKYDARCDRFWKKVCGGEFTLFVCKVPDDTNNDQLALLDRAIAKQRDRNNQPCNYVIIGITATSQTAERSSDAALTIRWLGSTKGQASVEQFAPSQQPHRFNKQTWCNLFERLNTDPIITARLKTPLVSAQARPASRADSNCTVFSADALTGRLLAQENPGRRYQTICELATQASCIEEFLLLLSVLERNFAGQFQRLGGDLLQHLLCGLPLQLRGSFDAQYLRGLYFLSGYNIDHAIAVNQSAAPLYEKNGSSLVRYNRISTALQRSRELLKRSLQSGFTVYPALPRPHNGFSTRTMQSIAQFNHSLKNTPANDTPPEAVQIEIRLAQTTQRHAIPVSSNDHSKAASRKWISSICLDDLESLPVLSLPDLRICSTPTGIVFREQSVYYFAEGISDLYHYIRSTCRVSLKPPLKKIPQAWLLPRFGKNNHYHSIVDKLPALYGYHILGLKCPIVSCYDLDAVEIALARQMGIDPDSIIVDLHGEYEISNALLPDVYSLQPLFFDYCTQIGQRIKQAQSNTDIAESGKLYISRLNSPQRSMVNEQAVEQLVQRHGYRVVRMEDLGFEQQIATIASATSIVAPHGAGLANMVFMPNGCDVIELIPEKYMTPLFKQLAINCGHRYSVLIGEAVADTKAAGSHPAPAQNIGGNISWQTDLQLLDSVLAEAVAA